MRWVVFFAFLAAPLAASAQEDGLPQEITDTLDEIEGQGDGAVGTALEFVPFYEAVRNAVSNNPNHMMTDAEKATDLAVTVVFSGLGPIGKGAKKGGKWLFRGAKKTKFVQNALEEINIFFGW